MSRTAPATSVRERREATVRRHIEAENQHDLEGTLATFASHRASYDIPAFGPAGQRPDAESVREMWSELFAVFPDIHIEPGPLRHGDDHIFVEILVTGTQRADWAGIPAQGRSFSGRMGALYEFEGPELVCERVYLDFADLARQLGAPCY